MGVEEEISSVLRRYAEREKDVRLVVITDDQGFVVGSYPYSKEKADLLETVGAVFSDILHQIFEIINTRAQKIAGKIAKISVGMRNRVAEFFVFGDLNVILFREIAED